MTKGSRRERYQTERLIIAVNRIPTMTAAAIGRCGLLARVGPLSATRVGVSSMAATECRPFGDCRRRPLDRFRTCELPWALLITEPGGAGASAGPECCGRSRLAGGIGPEERKPSRPSGDPVLRCFRGEVL